MLTKRQARALTTLTEFLLGPPPRKLAFRPDSTVTSDQAFQALEYLHSQRPPGPEAGVFFHSKNSLREEWKEKFGLSDFGGVEHEKKLHMLRSEALKEFRAGKAVGAAQLTLPCGDTLWAVYRDGGSRREDFSWEVTTKDDSSYPYPVSESRALELLAEENES